MYGYRSKRNTIIERKARDKYWKNTVLSLSVEMQQLHIYILFLI